MDTRRRAGPATKQLLAVALFAASCQTGGVEDPESPADDDTSLHTGPKHTDDIDTDVPLHPHEDIAPGIQGTLGSPMPLATPQMLEAFERGKALFTLEHEIRDGLGPYFGTQSCAGCHERPTIGGDAGLYRNGLIGGVSDGAGGHRMADTNDVPKGTMDGAVVRPYRFHSDDRGADPIPAVVTRVSSLNPLPLYGVGLFSRVPDDEILSRADPEDLDGDGISGRPVEMHGEIGRNGVKAEIPGIEEGAFSNFTHVIGLTVAALTEGERAQLPYRDRGVDRPMEPDVDAAPDPEIPPDGLIDILSYIQLLAIASFDPMTDRELRGRDRFGEIGCADCHTPRLQSDIGPLPAYTDLLLHDMGSLQDGISVPSSGVSGAEFRTQPLWNVAATGPYLHDGRAATLREAVMAHDGEALGARQRFSALTEAERLEIEDFLRTLGGREYESRGSRLLPDQPAPTAGELGASDGSIDDARFEAGRRLFDHMFSPAQGLGSPAFNGDSCTACHIQGAVGGSGRPDTNVLRQGSYDDDGFIPIVPSAVPKHVLYGTAPYGASPDARIVEHRQTSALFGLSRIELISESAIVSGADPLDLDGDGVRGRVPRLPDGELGRFGWKAQFAGVHDFVCAALTDEMGMTTSDDACGPYGARTDADAVADPEVLDQDVASISEFVMALAPPPPRTPTAASDRGSQLFHQLGCDVCHVPELPSENGPVPLYSDLLLHVVTDQRNRGIAQGAAGMDEYRTPPLWGIRFTAPYMHTGRASTYSEAIELHGAEATSSRTAWRVLNQQQRADLVAFLNSL